MNKVKKYNNIREKTNCDFADDFLHHPTSKVEIANGRVFLLSVDR
jgi:hypothetical protein